MAKKRQKSKIKLPYWLLSLLVLFVLIFSLKVLSGYIATSRDKADFKKIEQDIVAVQTELQKNSPQIPTTVRKYCHQDVEKFGGGSLNCIVEIRSNSSYLEREMLRYTKENQEAVLRAGFTQTREPNHDSLFYVGSLEKKDSKATCRLNYDSDLSSLKETEDKYYFSFRCAKKVHKFIY